MSTLYASTQFLSEVLNRRSAAINSGSLKIFLKKISELAQIESCDLKVRVKPLGKKCLHCGKYIPRNLIPNAIGLWCDPAEHLMCSVECLQRHALVCTNFTLLDLGYVTCPGCWTSIDADQIMEAFGDKFEDIQNDACDRALMNLLNEEGKKQIEAKFTCDICIVEFPVSEGLTLECDHRYCINCMKEYTKGLIEAAQVSEASLKCPKCPQPLTLYEIEDIVGPELFEKYQRFLLRGFKIDDQDDPRSAIFNCPEVNCEFFCIYDKELEEIECAKCFHVCCPACKGKVHKGMTCEVYLKSQENAPQADKLFEQFLLQQGAIKCPSCGAAVQRIDGCQFMVCTSSQCQGKTYFCYDCGIKLAADHAPHQCNRRLIRRIEPKPEPKPRRMRELLGKNIGAAVNRMRPNFGKRVRGKK